MQLLVRKLQIYPDLWFTFPSKKSQKSLETLYHCSDHCLYFDSWVSFWLRCCGSVLLHFRTLSSFLPKAVDYASEAVFKIHILICSSLECLDHLMINFDFFLPSWLLRLPGFDVLRFRQVPRFQVTCSVFLRLIVILCLYTILSWSFQRPSVNHHFVVPALPKLGNSAAKAMSSPGVLCLFGFDCCFC